MIDKLEGMTMSVHSEAREAFVERFSDVLDDDGIVKDGEAPGWDDWQDAIMEVADGLVPVYNADIVREWQEAGYPEVDDPGLVEGVTDVFRIMAIALYGEYLAALYEIAEEAGFDR